MKLKPVISIAVNQSLADIKGPPPPPGVPAARWNRGRNGNSDLSWHRGWQVGVHDAFLTIKERYPRVAKQLREAFNMDENGDVTL